MTDVLPPHAVVHAQASSMWRKVQGKLEGEEAYEDLDKMARLDVFAEYLKYDHTNFDVLINAPFWPT